MADNATLERHLRTLLMCKLIKENEVKDLCIRAKELLNNEANVYRMQAP